MKIKLNLNPSVVSGIHSQIDAKHPLTITQFLEQFLNQKFGQGENHSIQYRYRGFKISGKEINDYKGWAHINGTLFKMELNNGKNISTVDSASNYVVVNFNKQDNAMIIEKEK